MTIRWPWVSRAQLERLESQCRDWSALCRDTINTAEDREKAANARYDALAARYHMLKLQGAAEVEPLKPIVAKPVDPVMAAFNEAMAGKGPKVRKQGLAQLERDKAAGLSAAQIITRIHRGNRPADEIEETPTPKRTASEA